MKPTLNAHLNEDAYYLTSAKAPAKRGVDGKLYVYCMPGSFSRPVDDLRGVSKVSRFEFLANLATRNDSHLYLLGDVAVAVRGFAGALGWAFERDPAGVPGQGTVRPAYSWELNAEGTEMVRKIERNVFADFVCNRRPEAREA